MRSVVTSRVLAQIYTCIVNLSVALGGQRTVSIVFKEELLRINSMSRQQMGRHMSLRYLSHRRAETRTEYGCRGKLSTDNTSLNLHLTANLDVQTETFAQAGR